MVYATYIIKDHTTGATLAEARNMSEAIATVMDFEFSDMMRGVYEPDNYDIEMKGENET